MTTSSNRILTLILAFFCSSVLLFSQNGPSMFQGNPQHTGSVDPSTLGHLKGVRFAFQTNGPVRSVPAFLGEMLFVGSGDNALYAVNTKTGKEKWRFSTGGAVNSSPAVANGLVYFTSRDRTLYAVRASVGSLTWKYLFGNDVPYRNGFDYYTSSPTVDAGIIYVSGGDGTLVSLDGITGRLRWKTQLGTRIRSSPAISDGTVVIGGMDGKLYALDAKTGSRKWSFVTEGAGLSFDDFGFDRTSIVGSPSIAGDLVYFGCRDGFVYAVGLGDGQLRWKVDHKVSWAISTPGVQDGSVFTGTSDGRFFQKLDALTGAEQWKFTTTGVVWSSSAFAEDVVCFGDGGGYIFAVRKEDGKELWRFKTSGSVYTSPVIRGGVVYCGSDDGYLYALEGDGKTSSGSVKTSRAVYWEPQSGFAWFRNGVDTWVRDFFKNEGYEVVDSTGLAQFLQRNIDKRGSSVVVFAVNRIPGSILGVESEDALIRKYLNAAGKVVLLGPAPTAYRRDSTGGLTALDFTMPPKVFGVKYPGSALDENGWYGGHVTQDGTRWGLRGWWVGFASVDPSQVSTVLATDENGLAAAWVKNYGGPDGTGLVQAWIPRDKPVDLTPIREVAEHGLHR